MLSILSHVSGPSICSYWRSTCSGPLPIFNWVVCLPAVESCEFFYILKIKPLSKISLSTIFPHIFGSLFNFADIFFSHAEAFYFDEVPFVYSFLYVPCSRDISVKIMLHGISEIFLPVFSSRTSMV